METKSSARSTTGTRGFQMAKMDKASKTLGQLRHLGFRKIDLPLDSEFVSEGPSVFHELGFCNSGEVLVLVGHGFERVETFTVRKNDVFFLPAGTTYSVHNTADSSSTLTVASSREGVNRADLPLSDSGSIAMFDPILQNDVSIDSSRAPQSAGEVDGGYEVLVPHNARALHHEGSIGDVFDREVVAREFGVPESSLPEMKFGFFDPLVVRPTNTSLYMDENFSVYGFEWDSVRGSENY